jgi:formylglycine-generating enzyme required for sulfatase activity
MKKTITISLWSMFVSILMIGSQAYANGLVISNTSLTGQNTSTQTVQIRFNITWDNSWKDNMNWDAVWIFCKYRVGTNAWSHATLNAAGFQTGSGTPININVACDQKGAFISRRDIGSGTLAATQVELRWNYGVDGVLNSDAPDLNIYGMEMVYIPGGPFTIGDGNGVNSSSSGAFYAVSQHLPYTIDNLMSPNISATSNIVNASSTPANFVRIDGDGGIDLNLDGAITANVDSARFPTGFNAFYLQKYELTQGQYSDFLNTLNYTQQSNHMNNTTNVLGASQVDGSIGTNPNRNTILVQTIGVNPTTPRVFATARPDRVNTNMNCTDMMAYLDWAALRPFTELEYEKACRGPLAPTLNEYAWGSTGNAFNSSFTLSGTENGTETITSPTGIVHMSTGNTISQGDGGTGFTRVGITANSSTGRYGAGASYYGVINLGDNANEFCVTLGNVAGRSFRGDNGNGILNANGMADVPNWPGASGNNTTTTANATVNTGSTGFAGFLNKSGSSTISARSSLLSSVSRTTSVNIWGTARGARTAFSAEFSAVTANGVFISPNQSTSFTPAASAASYSWTFPSGTPNSSTVATPSVSWASAGTYNVSLTATEGTCSSTINSVVQVIPACSNPGVLSGNVNWTQNNNTYNNADNNNPRNLFDNNTGTSFMNTVCCVNGAPVWAIVDFGSVTSLTGIGVFNYVNSTTWAATDFAIEGGNSLTGPWTTVGSNGIPALTVGAWQDFVFAPAAYRYWKITFTNNLGPYIQMYEVRFNRCN